MLNSVSLSEKADKTKDDHDSNQGGKSVLVGFQGQPPSINMHEPIHVLDVGPGVKNTAANRLSAIKRMLTTLGPLESTFAAIPNPPDNVAGHGVDRYKEIARTYLTAFKDEIQKWMDFEQDKIS